MRYDLIASDDEILQASSAGLKRTKSFWKFGGGRSGEDILAGMSLWQHRDLVAAPNLEEMRDRDDLERRSDEDRNGTLTKSHNSSSSQEKRDRKDSLTSTEPYGDDDENIYGVSPQQPPAQQQQQQQQQQQHQQQQQQHRSSYTPKSRMKIMKTIEIDIEEPTEAERMSTMRRGQSQDHQLQQHRKLDKQVSGSGSQHKSQTLSRSKTAQQQQFPQSTDEGESDEHGTLKLSDVNNFFDVEGKNNSHGHGLVMKTVKRQDILKQYYTSEDEEESDAELKSTSSDPYDCIVINDHLVRKDDKLRRHHQQQQQHQQMEFHTFRSSTSTTATNTLKKGSSKEQDSTLTRNSTASSNGAPTATILPRTRLLKSSASASNNVSSATLERNSKSMAGNKSYGPWYDFWDQEQHGQKSASAKLK